jgi:hypothetical protein
MDIGTIVSLVLATFALAVSVLDFRFSKSTVDRPVLIFTLKAGTSWRVVNVGTGPAVNVVLADRNSTGDSEKVVNCYPLAAGGQIDVPWLNASHELVAVYTDVHARAYTTTCGQNRNRITRRMSTKTGLSIAINGAKKSLRPDERTPEYEIPNWNG